MKRVAHKFIGALFITIALSACASTNNLRPANNKVPDSYGSQSDTINSANINWRDFLGDTCLIALIDTALKNNQELNIVLQEINITRNEVMARKGEYLPHVNVGVGGDIEKVGRYTRHGAVETTTEIEPGREMPEPLPNLFLGANVSWEVDIWRKLRNARDAATKRYLASIEGKNFMVTNLVAEISTAYYELLGLDNQLDIIDQNISILKNAYRIVRQEKNAARVTELAVRKFQSEVLKNQSYKYYVEQQIVETENWINFLVGRFPQPVQRSQQVIEEMELDTIMTGVPSQLLRNRPDIREAEYELAAANLDIKVARARFYPSLEINANTGLQAFNPEFLLSPESILYSLAGDLIAPLLNRKAIQAAYFNANSRQIQIVYDYERTILTAYIETVNQLSQIKHLKKSYEYKSQQVKSLTESIKISTNLFKFAKADYMEVLMTQRDALEAKIELIEMKTEQLKARVKMFQVLGGGWK